MSRAASVLTALLLLTIAVPVHAQALQESITVTSPDGQVEVRMGVDEEGTPQYLVRYAGTQVLRPSPLGLETSIGEWHRGLEVREASDETTVEDRYQLQHGKQSSVHYEARQRVLRLANDAGQVLEVVAQVSNHGVALRYRLPQQSAPDTVTAEREHTGFRFAEDTRSWLMPMDPPDTGWSQTFPAYEGHYEEAPVGEVSPTGVGWAFPGLFQVPGGAWALVTEAGLDGSYHASRLEVESDSTGYRIAGPEPGEGTGPDDPVDSSFTLPFASPWRLIVLGGELGPIVESTLVTDVSPLSTVEDASFVQPGTVAWSWLPLKDASITLETQRRFIDMAAQHGFEYCLVDNWWDEQIGYDGIRELVEYADQKGVGLFLWYNSNGSFNEAPQTPQDRMHTGEARREEFAQLQEVGIDGVKVDFFGGDKQSVIQLYLDLFRDAAEHGLMVNVHGSTLPRGWHRTYPQFMTSEAVRGYEYITFGQEDADRAPTHSTVLPFTRNVVGPMDFTPTMLTDSVGASKRRTSDAFDLAMSVVFESGLQHFGVTPEALEQQPDYVGSFLGALPAAWDETRFLDGYPGEHVVLARRAGSRWYVAGINGQGEAQEVSLPMEFLDGVYDGALLTDENDRRTLQRNYLSVTPGDSLTIEMQGHGGFVVQLDSAQE